MMDQNKWDILEKVFSDETAFDGEGWYSRNDEFDIDLHRWLDCDYGPKPSGRMMEEFREHGYKVYPLDKDSFGWLIGCVRHDKTNRKIAFFG